MGGKRRATSAGDAVRLDSMNQLVLSKSAAERKGYQPVVQVSTGGKSKHVEVAVGKEIVFLSESGRPKQ
jgi:hypothetical protein